MLELDLTPDADKPFFILRSTLDGKDYDFDFQWGSRRSLWTLTVRTAAQEVLVQSRVLRHGNNILNRCHSANKPPGVLFCWSNTPADLTAPGVGDLGGRVSIYYGSAAELA